MPSTKTKDLLPCDQAEESHGLVKLPQLSLNDSHGSDGDDGDDDDIFGSFGTLSKRSIQAPLYSPSPTVRGWFLRPPPNNKVLSPSHRATLGLYAAAYHYAQGQYSETLALLQSTPRNEESSLEVLEMEARVWLRLGNPQKALAVWKTRRFTDPASLFFSAHLTRLNEFYEEALTLALDYLIVRPNDYKAWQEIVESFISLGSQAVSWALFSGFLSLHLLLKSQKDHHNQGMNTRSQEWKNQTVGRLRDRIAEIKIASSSSSLLLTPTESSLKLLNLSESVIKRLVEVYNEHSTWYEATVSLSL